MINIVNILQTNHYILCKQLDLQTSLRKEIASKLKQGAVIGSMERGPRMFGVRYGPCDRPRIELENLEDTKFDTKYDISLSGLPASSGLGSSSTSLSGIGSSMGGGLGGSTHVKSSSHFSQSYTSNMQVDIITSYYKLL